MKDKDKFRMPNGEWIADPVKMCKAWKNISEPICKEFGLKVIGYDPGILFSSGKYATFDLPTDIAIRISQLIKDKKKLENQLKKIYAPMM